MSGPLPGDPLPGDPLPGVPLGARVVVRFLIEGGERATDVVGELVGRDATSVTVAGRRGPVRVEARDIVAAKPVPAVAPRWRVASFLARAGVAVLDQASLHRVVAAAPDAGAATAAVAGLVDRLRADGTPVVVLDRGGDLGALPEVSVGEVHARIEARLGRTVGRGTVHYTDDRPEAVGAARDFGWQARVLTLP